VSLLGDLWLAGVAAVDGRQCVLRSLQAEPCNAEEIIAVGKAAAAMCLGAFDALGGAIPALVVTKDGHTDAQLQGLVDVRVIEAGHPVPNARSLVAGAAAHSRVREAQHLLLLVSGGASALAEELVQGVSLDDLAQMTGSLLAEGLDIAAMNTERQAQSLIKGGRLLADFQGQEVTVLAVSDVENDGIGVIGSGIGDADILRIKNPHASIDVRIVGSNGVARAAIAMEARRRELTVCCNRQSMHADLYTVVARLADELMAGAKGLYIWGGEPTVVLPEHPGQGGRNQSLAVALWAELCRRQTAIGRERAPGFDLLVAGTDGTDGPTAAAGGQLSTQVQAGEAQIAAAEAAVDAADAGSFLRHRGDLLITGPTGTNVMDIALCIKH